MDLDIASIETDLTAATHDRAGHVYAVYGIALHSEIVLALPAATAGASFLARIELKTASEKFFEDRIREVELKQRPGSWYFLGEFPDGAVYARWDGVGEFWVSGDGSSIVSRPLGAVSSESFQVYLLAQALSFALVKIGLETYHATTVVVEGGAVAFLGDGGWGKSSLAASFLDAGYSLLTDDVLMLRPGLEGVLAYPGPPRIKLFPDVAERYLKDAATGVPMNAATEKLVIPLSDAQTAKTAVPLKAIYCLGSPREAEEQSGITIESLSAGGAVIALIENSFNRRVLERPRRERQLQAAAWLANVMPVNRLVIPRNWAHLEIARDAIIRRVSGSPGKE